MALSLLPSVNASTTNGSDVPRGTQPSGKLKKLAQEFESILLQSWLENMNHSFVGDSESQDAAHDTVSSLATQAIASALAVRGGIGIAAMLLRQLQPADRPVNDPGFASFPPPKTGRKEGTEPLTPKK